MGEVIVKILSIVAWPLVWLIDRLVNQPKKRSVTDAEKKKDDNITPDIARAIKEAKDRSAHKRRSRDDRN